MKVLLVQPPVEDYYDTPIRTYPLGLAYIAARIEDACDVSVLDCRTGYKGRTAKNDFPELDEFYRKDRRTPFSLFTRYSRYGMEKKELYEAIQKESPDIIGISSSFAAYSRQAAEIAAVAKEVDQHIVTVMGGTHPTLFPHSVLEDGNVDYVVRGEGETPFLELVQSLRSGTGPRSMISGISFRRNGTHHIGNIHIEDDIETIPARHLLPVEKYCIGKNPYTFLLTSRGCPFNCSFCGKPPLPYRRRTLKSIEKEVGQIAEMGIKAIDFEDDMLNLDITFFRNVLDMMKGRSITLSAMNGLYGQTLDIDTLTKMHEAGFSRLNFSLVDTSHAVNATQRRAYPANFLKILDWLEASPFMIEAHFIIGLPGQTPAEIVNTLIFLMGKRVLPGPSIYYPAPGSPLFDDLCGDPSASFRYCRSSVMFEANPVLPRRTIFTFMKLLRFINTVKSLIDDTPGASCIGDLVTAPSMKANPKHRYVFDTLLKEKRFIALDTREHEYVEEPQDKILVAVFLEAMKGGIIKGYRTHNRIMCP
ncbi:MAG: cobalamin B12-binding domain protein [Deltaproteobacteria bacterium]|nr:cobalamin B12-binding domain protein [Deltaproteobacteria bacterium]